MGDIDEAFIQSIEHRPENSFKSIQPEEIPLIDLSIEHTPKGTERLVSQIGHACKNWGFFQVINHGVSSDLRSRIEKMAKEFFDLPPEEKSKVRRDEVNSMGYYDNERTKNVRDWKETFDFFLRDPTTVPASPDPDSKELIVLSNRWPEYPSQFRETFEEYAVETEKLALKLLGLISLSLGLPANRFNRYFEEQQTSRLRVNHYPPCPNPELALGVGRHKDGGALTVLAQDDVGGLQVRRKSDGEWISVKPVYNTYVINIGDVMQVWSNDVYSSAEHRVIVNSQKERYSVPFFFLPGHHVMVKPLEEVESDPKLVKYKEYNWGKYFVNRRLSNFKKLGVPNIQIDDFKILQSSD